MLWDLLRALHQQGKTILLTTHYIEEAEQLCERVSIINDGSIVSEGTPQELISSLGKGIIEVSLSGWDGSHEVQMSDFDFVFEPETDGDRLIFSVDNPGKELPRIVAVLSSNGCHIHEVKINKSSLEDVFIAITGRGIND